MMKQATKYPKLILDMRGNGGGYVIVEQYLLSHFFDHEVKIADLVTRKKTETRLTKPLGDRQYKGQIAVLVDRNSASASEMTARVLQLEKRAIIYGDYSSGSVTTSFTMPFRSVMSALSDAAIIKVGMSVTVADVKMRDGSRLENVGVIPDQILQPSAIALAKKMDAVLAYAAVQFGVEVSPEKAGTYHFMAEADEYNEDEESGDPN
jgi:C-terminal processing protease CtpA/Prc